ncbi:myelin regulatory factor-like protein isoform X2 [Anguilla rostrata]|uniref:myelin regulatory factor-like protein isoform X2 n=1 Tax=Anguilla rostrata TaxID=7938 RepID=UPI0030D5AA53
MDVLGENEALRQFFEGQDVRGVLESEVVDTSILEQYLSNDMDPSTFMLPESPPDSGSEPCSPPRIRDVPHDRSCSAAQAGTGPSCCLGDRGPGPSPCLTPQQRFLGLESACPAPLTPPGLNSPCHPQYLSPACQNIQAHTAPTHPGLHHSQNLRRVGTANGYIQSNTPPTPPNLHHSQNLQRVGTANSYTQANTPPTAPDLHHSQNLQCVGPANSYTQANTPPTPPNLHHSQNLQRVAPANGYIQANTPPTAPNLHHSQNLQRVAPANGYIQANTHPTPPVNGPPGAPHCMNPASGYVNASPPPAPPGLQQVSPGHLEPGYLRPPLSQQQTGPALPDTKKRRRSESFEGPGDPRLWPDPSQARGPFMPPECASAAGDITNCDSDGQGGTAGQGTYQVLAWEGYQPNQWSPLYDSGYQNLPSPGYHVDTDKGFSYSSTDEAFVCQKKNHFQVTVHIGMAGTPKYVKTPSGPKPIESFYVKVFGVKSEAQSHQITIEQSQSDRTKKPFLPVQVSLPGDKVTKVTLGRLHFSETTANNMRKKGKPNPDQRYFMLVVGLYASGEEQNFLLAAHVSEKIIVRASNPGQFENDSEPLWQRGQALDAAVCQGRVGINTDAPDEALVVCGNAKIMGAVMHPSDMRAKQNIQEVDSTEQLKRIAQMRIVEYDYRPEFAEKMGIDQVHETGVIAQEVKELLPSAVKEVGEITCADGETIDNFLMVDKEQIFMENVGAVKQLCKLTDSLQERIQELEVWNTRLARLKSVTGSLRSGAHRKASRNDSVPLPKKPAPLPASKEYQSKKHSHCLQHRVFQASVIMLVVTMGICVISITALYMLNLNDGPETPHSNSNNSILDETTTTWPPIGSPSVTPTLSPDPWPPDVDFCNLLYCEEVYCCPPDSGNHSIPATTPAPRPPTNDSQTGTNTTVQSIVIKENLHVIDQRYCVPGNCGSGNYSYAVPVSKFVPVNMRLTIQMNTTELLVVLRCQAEESSDCSAFMDYTDDNDYTMSNTQGYVHEWPLPVTRLYQSSYHFRTTVAGKADCSTDPNFSGVLFTDYHFHFYRRCD